jgi:hypothetical protein
MEKFHSKQEAPSPQLMTDTVEAVRPQKTKGSFRRSPQGQFVMRTCALWIIERLAASGITFEQWFAAGCNLADIGVHRVNAIAELQAAILDAHRWYNESGNGKQYATWEAYFSGSLANRIYYFFRKHADGKIVVAVAEWPGTVSEDGLSLIPPPLPQGVADDPEEDRPAVPPGTGLSGG